MEEIVCRHGILVSLSPAHIIHPRYQNVADPFALTSEGLSIACDR
jgi:hypothetical protein